MRIALYFLDVIRKKTKTKPGICLDLSEILLRMAFA